MRIATGILSGLRITDIFRMFFGHVSLGYFLKNFIVSSFPLISRRPVPDDYLKENIEEYERESKWVLVMTQPSLLESFHFEVFLPITNWPYLPECSLFINLRKAGQ